MPLYTSGGGSSGDRKVLADIPPGPALVVSTPGVEPLARYGAALLLDAAALLARPSLRAAEEALRRSQADLITKLRAEGKIERIGAPAAPATPAPAAPTADQKK